MFIKAFSVCRAALMIDFDIHIHGGSRKLKIKAL